MNDSVTTRVLSRKWFYAFRLPGGEVTDCYLPSDLAEIHTTRETMLLGVLDPLFASRWGDIRALDIACHEGFFSFSLARRGCQEVVGLDARQQNLDGASLMRDALGLRNTRFALADVTRLDPRDIGQFDVTVLFGLLYHVSDPVGLLQFARAVTTHVCVIETQVVPDSGGSTDWGSYRSRRDVVGCLSVVDETDCREDQNREANLAPISLVPSLTALIHILKAVGFARVEVVPPPPGAHEQIADGKRVVVAAFTDAANRPLSSGPLRSV